MSIQLTTTLAPSGAFCVMPQADARGSFAPGGVGAASDGNNYLIYNPGVLQYHRGSFTTEQIDAKAVELITKSKESPLIEKAEIDVYGQTCIRLAKDLASVGGHLRLGPLRGAARPCLLMDVMASGSGDFTFFNYKEGSDSKNANRVKSELYPILAAADPNEATYRIQVLDTAVRGDGINALRCYLMEIKESHNQFCKQKWELDLRIIHANDERTDVGNIERVQAKPVPGVFEVQLARYIVPDLMVEDYEAALGLEIAGDKGNFLVKQSYRPGRFVLRGNDGTRLVRSDSLVVTFDELFSQSITDEMIHASDLKQVGVVWSDYTLKG